MSNIRFTMKDLDGTVMPYTSFVISTSTSANAASFTTNLNGEATVTLAAVTTPYYISKQDGTTESVIAYKFFVPNTTYTLDAELLFVDMGKISKDKNDKSIAALIEAKVVAVNAANRALQVVSLLGDVSTIRDNLTNLVQVASNLTNINAVNANATNITTVASNTANINKVATIDTNVTTVANSQASVNTVATNIANVNTVAPHTANIGTVATNIGSVTTVSGSIASVNTTASNIANVNTVAGNTSNISTVAGISPAVSTVANNIADIQTTAEGIGLIPDVLPYTSNITTVANNIAPIIAVGNNINNINEVRAMEADIEVLADEIANIAGAAAAVTQAVDAQKVLYVAGTDYTKNTSNTLTLPYFPAKSNSVKIFFDGVYKNKDTWNRVGKSIVFTSVINADKVEIQYEVPSSFVGLGPEDILVIQNAEAAALASEVDAQQSATAAAVSASIAQGVANQAVDAIKQLFVAGTNYTKNTSTQLTMDFLPVKTNAVKVFFDGIYQNKNTFTRLEKIITFNEAINVDNVEIHYEVPSQFVGLDDDDNAVLVAAQNAAQASANAAAASFDSFDDRYIGAKSVAPTVDNDGNVLLVGAKYFNSTENKMYVRNSSNAWQLDTADSSTVNYLPAGTGAVATTVQSKLRESVSVKDFGAVGDGVADDTAAFQAAAAHFGSGGALAVPNGGVLFVPKGLYKVTGQTLFQRPGVRVIGEGLDATKITVAADLGWDAAVFKFDQTLSYYSMVGVGVENLHINMVGFIGHGVHMLKPYDGVSLRNLFVEDVADGYNGYRVEPDPDNTADTISQTLVLENCSARHKNATATAPLFYLSNLQESVLTACKAFGTYEWHGKAPCYPFEFVDCRGIMLNGCSSAFASKHGVKITVLTRPSTGFLIANHTFETIDGAVRADGLAGIGDVIDLCVVNPRTEGAVANPSGAFDLNRVIRSSIAAGRSTVNIDADSIANTVLSGDTTQVTDAGQATTILGSANQADTLYKIIAGGLRVSNAGTQHLVTSNELVQLYSSGAVSVQAEYPWNASQVGALLAVNRAGTVTLSRVEIGVANSGGTGFRMLRVAN